jgi:hypothetical protein
VQLLAQLLLDAIKEVEGGCGTKGQHDSNGEGLMSGPSIAPGAISVRDLSQARGEENRNNRFGPPHPVRQTQPYSAQTAPEPAAAMIQHRKSPPTAARATPKSGINFFSCRSWAFLWPQL